MGYVPVVTEDQDALEFGSETLPKPTSGQTFKTEVTDQLLHMPFSVGLSHITQVMNHHYKVGNFLNPDQIKQKYPNVSYPKGEYESVVRQASLQRGIDDFHSTVLNMSTHTLSKLSGWAIGNFLTPSGVLLGGSIDALAGRLGSTLISKIPEINGFSRLALRISRGVGEGALISAPFSASAYYHRKDLSEPYAALAALENFGAGMVLGGVLRTVFGFKEILPPLTNDAAIKTASDQFKSGKSIDVEPIIKDGLHKQNISDNVSLEDAQNSKIVLDNYIDKKEKEFSPELEKFKKNIDPDEQGAWLTASQFKDKEDFIDNWGNKSNILPERLGIIYDKSLENDNEIKNILKPIENLKDISNGMEHYINLKINSPNAITPNELASHIKTINSWKGESTTDLNDYMRQERFKEETKEEDTPQEIDTKLKQYKDLTEETKEGDLLNEKEKKEFQDNLDKMDLNERNTKKVHDALRNFIKCALTRKEI